MNGNGLLGFELIRVMKNGRLFIHFIFPKHFQNKKESFAVLNATEFNLMTCQFFISHSQTRTCRVRLNSSCAFLQNKGWLFGPLILLAKMMDFCQRLKDPMVNRHFDAVG